MNVAGPRRRSSAVGDKVGQWTLTAELGSGGSSRVFIAENEAGQEVALKIVVRHHERFLDEIKVYQRLGARPGILPVIDAATEDVPWLATEVAALLVTHLGPNPQFRAVVEAFASYSATLADLANEDVHHRDIKPPNLYFLNGQFVLGDFGIADFPEKAGITGPGEKLGPANYMADEMLTHKGEGVSSEKADVFSLAKSLWAVAASERFPPQGELRRDRPGLSISVRVSDPRSSMLEDLLQRATQHDPSARPTMREVANELSWWLGSEPVVATLDLSAFKTEIDYLEKGHQLEPAETEEQRLNRIYNKDIRKFRDAGRKLGDLIATTGLTQIGSPLRWAENLHPEGYGGGSVANCWGVQGIPKVWISIHFGLSLRADETSRYDDAKVSALITIVTVDSQTDLFHREAPVELGSLEIDSLAASWFDEAVEVLPDILRRFLDICRDTDPLKMNSM